MGHVARTSMTTNTEISRKT